MSSRFIEFAQSTKDNAPDYIVCRLRAYYRIDALEGRRMLVVGNVRESSVIALLQLLLDEGCELAYHDALTPWITIEGDSLLSTCLTPENVADQDAVILVSSCADLPIDLLLEHGQLVCDIHYADRGRSNRATILLFGGE